MTLFEGIPTWVWIVFIIIIISMIVLTAINIILITINMTIARKAIYSKPVMKGLSTLTKVII